MKSKLSLVILSIFTLAIIQTSKAQQRAIYNGYPLMISTDNLIDIKIDDFLVFGKWEFTPGLNMKSNTINIPFLKPENISIHTKVDSLNFLIDSENPQRFFILNDTIYTLITIQGAQSELHTLSFDTDSTSRDIVFWYEQNDNNKYLQLLRSKFPIDSLLEGVKTDMDKTLRVMNWVHNQWQHDGNNEPRKNDAISILEEVKEGKNFRCVEYAIVASACLNAVGLKARTIGLKIKDVETTEYGAGHVATEVFLNDMNKWAFVDVQFNTMPVLNGIPLNAVEFQQTINNQADQIEIKSLTKLLPASLYLGWIYPYLYYFDVDFDNREGVDQKQKIDGKSSLMLVPLGAKTPTVFQIKYPLENFKYTNSLADFYTKPLK